MSIRPDFTRVILCIMLAGVALCLSSAGVARAGVAIPGEQIDGCVDLYSAVLACDRVERLSLAPSEGVSGAHVADPQESELPDSIPFWQQISRRHLAANWAANGIAGSFSGSPTFSVGGDSAPPASVSERISFDAVQSITRLQVSSDASPANPPPADLLKPPRNG